MEIGGQSILRMIKGPAAKSSLSSETLLLPKEHWMIQRIAKMPKDYPSNAHCIVKVSTDRKGCKGW